MSAGSHSMPGCPWEAQRAQMNPWPFQLFASLIPDLKSWSRNTWLAKTGLHLSPNFQRQWNQGSFSEVYKIGNSPKHTQGLLQISTTSAILSVISIKCTYRCVYYIGSTAYVRDWSNCDLHKVDIYLLMLQLSRNRWFQTWHGAINLVCGIQVFAHPIVLWYFGYCLYPNSPIHYTSTSTSTLQGVW